MLQIIFLQKQLYVFLHQLIGILILCTKVFM